MNKNQQMIKILKLKIKICLICIIINLLLIFSCLLAIEILTINGKYSTIYIEKQKLTTEYSYPVAGVENILNDNYIIDYQKTKIMDLVSLGEHKLTAYCSCEECCGEWSKYNRTASGTAPRQGRTVASNSLDFGTKVMINGEEYIVEDTGNMKSDNHIDIYFSSHDEALEFGVQNAEVYQILN